MCRASTPVCSRCDWCLLCRWFSELFILRWDRLHSFFYCFERLPRVLQPAALWRFKRATCKNTEIKSHLQCDANQLSQGNFSTGWSTELKLLNSSCCPPAHWSHIRSSMDEKARVFNSSWLIRGLPACTWSSRSARRSLHGFLTVQISDERLGLFRSSGLKLKSWLLSLLLFWC